MEMPGIAQNTQHPIARIARHFGKDDLRKMVVSMFTKWVNIQYLQ